VGPLSSRAISPEVAAATAKGRGRYLGEVLGTLWPPPTRVARCGPWPHGAANRDHATEFVIVPSERRAVLLLPRRPRRVAAAALRHYKASATARDRRKLDMLALGAFLGLADVLPHRVRIERGSTGDVLTDYLSAALGQDVMVSLYIGPPRANRKPVLQALAPDGAVAGFVKVGVDPLTCGLVHAEAAALAVLEDAPLVKMQPPRLLWHGQWRGHEVLVEQAFPRGRRARDLGELADAMAELAAVRGVTVTSAASSPYWQNLRSRLHALGQRDTAAALLQALDHAEAVAGVTALRFGSWHGDWTPWNMTISQGRALVWDWERFETGVPVGYDAVHYALQQAVRGGMAAEPAAEDMLARAPEILAPFDVDPSAARLVSVLYLIEIGARYLHDGQAEAGAQRGRVDRWLLPVLARHLQDGGPSRRGAEPASQYRQGPDHGIRRLCSRSRKRTGRVEAATTYGSDQATEVRGGAGCPSGHHGQRLLGASEERATSAHSATTRSGGRSTDVAGRRQPGQLRRLGFRNRSRRLDAGHERKPGH
jgi:hypothetical protein